MSSDPFKSNTLPVIQSATPLKKAIIAISKIAPLMAGEDNCFWKVWLSSNYEKYPEIKEDKDWSSYNEAHTELLKKTREKLIQDGATVFTEGENEFNLEGAAGFVKGKCDLVAHESALDRWTILDPKSGRQKASHVLQVKLYMWLLPYTKKYKDIKFNGAVVYGPDHWVPIPHESLTSKFIAEAKATIAQIGSVIPATKVPSRFECKYCRIPQLVCPEKFDETAGAVKVDLF